VAIDVYYLFIFVYFLGINWKNWIFLSKH